MGDEKILFIVFYVAGALCMDIYMRKISNSYILLGALFCVLQTSLVDTMWKILLTLLLLFPLYELGALGAGDIKLLCVLSGMSSLQIVIQIVVEAMLITAIGAAGIMFVQCIVKKKSEKRIKLYPFPFILPVFLVIIERV